MSVNKTATQNIWQTSFPAARGHIRGGGDCGIHMVVRIAKFQKFYKNDRFLTALQRRTYMAPILRGLGNPLDPELVEPVQEWGWCWGRGRRRQALARLVSVGAAVEIQQGWRKHDWRKRSCQFDMRHSRVCSRQSENIMCTLE
jgi:hypothetical protein